ncbi:MAG: hypothetical protein ACRD1P_09040 [Thermoanaerobaculia bacterium]
MPFLLGIRSALVALKWPIFGVVVLVLVTKALLLRRLRTRHEQTWRELWEPTLFSNNSPRIEKRLNRYLRSGGPAESGDEVLRRLAVAYAWSWRVLAAVMCLMVIVGLAIGFLR